MIYIFDKGKNRSQLVKMPVKVVKFPCFLFRCEV